MGLEIRNTRELLTDPKVREPWPENWVDWTAPRDSQLFEEYEKILNEATNEKPLQAFFTDHPYLLALAFPLHNCWMFPKPRLGGGTLIPDFLLCDLNSLGYHWTLIELESPTMEATNNNESISADTHHAVQQIRDYRRWVRDNALFEEKQRYRGLNADCDGFIVIGRRDDRTALEQERLADFRREHIEIASYDRLLVLIKSHLQSLNRPTPATAAAPKAAQ